MVAKVFGQSFICSMMIPPLAGVYCMQMAKPIISIIAALGERSRAIGKLGSLLWKIPGDLPRFKTLTTGHPVIMGRKTFESIGKVLPNRTNIVISHVANHKIPGCVVVGSPEKALEKALELDNDEIFI